MIKYAGGIYGCGEDDASLKLRQRPHVLKQGAIPFDSPHAPQPRIEHGRWIVDCPCGSGAGVSVSGKAYCFECGAIMTIALPAPELRAEVETELSSRPAKHQNWRPDKETLEQVRADVPA